MNKPRSNVPEPMLPEHRMIRDAAPDIVLSEGLKLRVMGACSRGITIARWKFRVKAGLSLLATCAALLLMLRVDQRNQPADALGELPEPESALVSPGSYPTADRPPDRSVVDQQPKPPVDSKEEKSKQQTQPSREAEQIHLLIEELKLREKKLCGMLPWI